MKAKRPFWLDGGYDFDSVQGCPYHPHHKWWTFRLSDVLEPGSFGVDQMMTICSACYVPRCGSTADTDRCTLWRHHRTAHVYESGVREPLGGIWLPAEGANL